MPKRTNPPPLAKRQGAGKERPGAQTRAKSSRATGPNLAKEYCAGIAPRVKVHVPAAEHLEAPEQ